KTPDGTGFPPVNADPFVWVDPDTGRVFNIDLYGGCSWLNYSDTKGDSWQHSPAACGNIVNDHQTITAGKPVAGLSTIGYPKILYYCFNRVVDGSCGRSLDGGLTWTPTTPGISGIHAQTRQLCSSLHGHARTDSAGRLFIPYGHCGEPTIAFTEDAGTTWSRVRVSTVNSAGTHLSVAVDAADNLYFVWWDSQKRRPYLAVSRDHGRTWSDPMMIAPPGVAEANFPVIAAGDEGHIAVSFPSSTTGTGNRKPWDQTVIVSTNALDEQPVFLSATANDPADPIHRGACSGRCGGLWDFLDIVVASQGELWAAASDDCVDTCVTGNGATLKAGRGIAIRQIGGPLLREPKTED
ncbi:MAG: exo-alpha-sialidase, partial [Actinomycetota bacterium]|nr:exo-alpha-sialidase [Actinomycetota bacterium]